MFALYVSPQSPGMMWSAHSAADRGKAHVTAPFINLEVNAALSRMCRMCRMFFQHAQLIAKSSGVHSLDTSDSCPVTPVTPVTSPGVSDLHL